MRQDGGAEFISASLKRAKKRGQNLDQLYRVLRSLAAEEMLAEKHRDHALTGNYKGFRECHIEPDWRLIYRIDADVLELFLFTRGRTLIYFNIDRKTGGCTNKYVAPCFTLCYISSARAIRSSSPFASSLARAKSAFVKTSST